MNDIKAIITCFELHSAEGIKQCFEQGVNPNEIINGKPLIYELINMYTRSPNFKKCIKTFVDYGLNFEDKILLSVLLDDSVMLDQLLSENKSAIQKKYSFQCAYTPLHEVSLMHICAEFNHLNSAITLFKYGGDINDVAGIDEFGFGGHTPIFHTVNQHNNMSLDMLKFLLSKQVDLSVHVKGIIWGKAYSWETFIPDVNPISYAMMGLLRQFQRTEEQIYEVVSLMLKAKYNIAYFPKNIPNKYLKN